MIGKALAHYEITGVLGKGGMGEVYRARDSKLGRDVALKILPPEIAGDPGCSERFRREALAVAALKNPNIVTLYSAEEADGIQFLTMELVEGGTLQSVLTPEGIELDRFFELSIPVAQAIASAHEKGITHRDLKPGNIMLDEEGRPQILDFGLAQMIQEATDGDATILVQPELTSAGTVIGTVGYMAPEQAEGRPTDPRADIFSLGVILYELSTGHRPFEGDSAAQIISSILRDDPASVVEVREELPHHLGRIVKRCLEKDPKDRYQTARDLHNELRDLRDEMTIERHSGIRPGRAKKGIARPVLAAAAVVAVGVTAATFFLRGGPEAAHESVDSGLIRIVVLPMENLGNPDDEFFADGMTEEVTNRLTSIAGLGVISNKSAETYAGRDVSVQQIGEELDVEFVLSGSVRWAKSGNAIRVRISPQLIRVADDTQLWAGAYDRTLEDVFEIQSDIARQVIAELGVALGTEGASEIERVPTRNAAAHEFYLRAIAKEGGYDFLNLTEMRDLLEQAIALDADFAHAWADLARTRSLMIHLGHDDTPEGLAAARSAANQALRLAANESYPHIAMGYFQYHALKNYAEAARSFALAADIRPNDPELLRGLGLVQRRQGRWLESTRNLEAALALNPRDLSLILELCGQYAASARWQKSDQMLAMARGLRPEMVEYYTHEANTALSRSGDLAAARAALEKIDDTTPTWIAELYCTVEVYSENYAAALERIAASRHPVMLNGAMTRTGAIWRGLIHQLAGNEAEARGNLEFAVGQLEEIIASRNDDFRFESARGIVNAALGRHEQARIHAERTLELFPLMDDLNWGAPLQIEVAQIYAMIGDIDEALAYAEIGLSWPGGWTAERMALDPWLRAITEHPEFEAMARRAAANRAALFVERAD